MNNWFNYTDLIGVSFKNRGRDIENGVDCYGLVMEVYRRFGISIPEYNADYDNIEKVNELITSKTSIKSNWRCVNINNMPVPCLLAIRFGVPKGIVNHTGVYIGNGKFIHIRENTGVCIDRVNSPAWHKMIEGCYEFIGDNNGKASNN